MRKANISRRTWYRLLNADIQEAKLSTLLKVANALDTTVTELLQIYFEGKVISSTLAKSRLYSVDTECGVDINFPDNSLVNVGEVFTKTWQITNRSQQKISQITLQSIDDQLEVRMVRGGSGEMSKPYGLTSECQSFSLLDLPKGEAREISVTFTAPLVPCTTISHWCFFENGKELSSKVLPHLHCQVKVVQIN